MPSFRSLLPPWRDTLTETTTIRQTLIDCNGNKVVMKKCDVLKRVLPAPPKNEAFDFVASAWPGRAVYAKSSVSPDSIVAASEALAQIEARTADRVMTIFNWVMQFSAQRAEQKAKLSAQRAEQKAKLSTQRAEQMAMLIDRTAHLFSAMRAQRMAQQTKMAEPKAAAPMQRALARAPYVKAAYAVAALAAVGAGVAVASQRAHVPAQDAQLPK